MLEPYHKAAIENTGAAAKNFAYRQMRCELVAPKNVRKAVQDIIDTNDDKNRRYIALDNLKSVLRKDLKVDFSRYYRFGIRAGYPISPKNCKTLVK